MLKGRMLWFTTLEAQSAARHSRLHSRLSQAQQEFQSD